MIRIAVDVYGGDNAPDCVLDGALEAMREMPDIHVIFCGAQEEVRKLLASRPHDEARVRIIDAPDVITNHESPTLAIRRKLNASLVKTMDAVKAGEADAAVTAGSTGAALAGGIFRIGRIRGINRPALAPLLPTAAGKPVMLIDCGANVDCKPEYLVQFALMGQAYMRGVMGVDKPKVGLLNIGAEDEKGNDLAKSTFPLLRDHPLVDFYGNVEARDALTGCVQVIVCDGFAGNILLKSTEGAAQLILGKLKDGPALLHALQGGRAARQARAQGPEERAGLRAVRRRGAAGRDGGRGQGTRLVQGARLCLRHPAGAHHGRGQGGRHHRRAAQHGRGRCGEIDSTETERRRRACLKRSRQ